MRGFLLILLTFTIATEAYAKKDFKGLFGSYRRERFVENEAKSTDFGMDIMLSTLLPFTPLVKSSEDPTRVSAGEPLHYATFFNFETSFFVTLSYEWEIFLNLGYYTYDTRKENTERTQAELPLFHQFELDAFPALLGVKYRLSTDDIVPYIGVAGGMAYVRRKGFYDYNAANFNEEHINAITAQLLVGLEFFFASRAGIRLEAGATYFKLPARTYDTGGDPRNFPVLNYQANPISLRYASGIFFLF